MGRPLARCGAGTRRRSRLPHLLRNDGGTTRSRFAHGASRRTVGAIATARWIHTRAGGSRPARAPPVGGEGPRDLGGAGVFRGGAPNAAGERRATRAARPPRWEARIWGGGAGWMSVLVLGAQTRCDDDSVCARALTCRAIPLVRLGPCAPSKYPKETPKYHGYL